MFKHKMKSWGVDYAKHEQEKKQAAKAVQNSADAGRRQRGRLGKGCHDPDGCKRNRQRQRRKAYPGGKHHPCPDGTGAV